MARDYRSDAYRQALLNELDPATGQPFSQVNGTSNYTMAAPSYAQSPNDVEGILSQYDRRNEGAGGVWSGAGKGALTGLSVGKYIGPMGAIPAAAGGALIGGAIGAFTKNAKSAMTDFSVNDARDAIAKGYQSRLGRDAGQDEISGQLRNVGWQDGDQWVGEMGLNAILNSLDPANDKRVAGSATGAGASPSPGGGATTAPAAPAAQGQFTGGSGALVDPYTLPKEEDIASLLANAQRYTGYDASTGRSGFAGDSTGGYASHGFDFGQDPGNRDVGKSAKYAFAQLSKEASLRGEPMPTTKAEAEAWFNKNIAPGFNALGYTVSNVTGDKAVVKTREGTYTLDFLSNAGGDNPALWWGVDDGSGGMSAPAQGGGVGSASNAGMDLTSSALFEQLMKQVRDIAEGKSNGALVTDTNALLNLLGSR